MKNTRKFLCLVLALIVFLSLALPAMASELHPAYVSCSGTTRQNGSLLVSTARIGRNPDNALLRITQELQSGDYKYHPKSSESAPGVVSYTWDPAMFHLVDYPPNFAYVCYEVYGGNSFPAHAWYGSCPINSSII